MNTTHAETTLRIATLPVVVWASQLAGCAGVQSTFSTFGVEAEATRTLAIWMAAGAAAITVGMCWLAWHAARAPEGRLDQAGGMRVILLGAAFTTVVLTVLLVFSLPKMRALAAQPGDLVVAVDGEQFWWRVRYQAAGKPALETANEIRVPVGRTVRFLLASPDVIHSFWIPGLGGKMDMIPGRTNELVVRATRSGVFRGVCAEFCGLGHARMAFDVIAMEAGEFDQWMVEAAAPAAAIDGKGRALFESYGCGGCHAVRGHATGTTIGPDLTHFGSRRSLGAGTLPMTREAVSRFVRDAAAVKPGVLMPRFAEMSPEDADAIAAYLVKLR